MANWIVGIDTGSTFTDGALLDYDSRQIIATSKALTTKHDLSVGITKALDELAISDVSQIVLVSISTTLATNSIVERRNRPVALVLIGYDPELVEAFDLSSRFATPILRHFSGGHNVYAHEQATLELDAIIRWIENIQSTVSAIAVSSYFSPLDPSHEERVFEALSRVTKLPIVLGHELSAKLDSVRRAATAALNASLISTLQDLIEAVENALCDRNITAPLMVVKGDGTLMPADTAVRRPLETILSGPAASAIGGRFLSGRSHAVVIDVGGTTTDICCLEDGEVGFSERGAEIASFPTAIQTARIRTVGLGGDSEIRFDRWDRPCVGPSRVAPLCYLASAYPSVHSELLALSKSPPREASPAEWEYWFLLREDPTAPELEHSMLRDLVDILRHGPRSLASLLRELDAVDPLQFNAAALLNAEIVARAGLTPTDLLHVDGRFVAWDRQAAFAVVDTVARVFAQSPAELTRQISDHIAERIVEELLLFVSHKRFAPETFARNEDIGRWFFNNALHPSSAHFETSVRLKQPIVALGAPAKEFLSQVAEWLDTELIFPEHYPVGNAVGAAAANVVVRQEALVLSSPVQLNPEGYCVRLSTGQRDFANLATALAYAREAIRCITLEAASSLGAADPTLFVTETPLASDGLRVVAKAVGNPRLGSLH